MTNEHIINIVKAALEGLLQENTQHFIVEIKVRPTNNIKVFLDGDNGIGIDELVRYNKALYKNLEEAALFPEGDFSLEVSSAGLGEPLKSQRQYLKNINRDVEVVLTDGVGILGKMTAVNETAIEVEEIKGKGKKAEMVKHVIPFENIKTTKIQIKF